jgi:hypothetical protein
MQPTDPAIIAKTKAERDAASDDFVRCLTAELIDREIPSHVSVPERDVDIWGVGQILTPLA